MRRVKAHFVRGDPFAGFRWAHRFALGNNYRIFPGRVQEEENQYRLCNRCRTGNGFGRGEKRLDHRAAGRFVALSLILTAMAVLVGRHARVMRVTRFGAVRQFMLRFGREVVKIRGPGLTGTRLLVTETSADSIRAT